MKNFLVKNLIIFFVAFVPFALKAQNPGHQIQGTIKPGSASNTVDIYFKPDFSNTSEYFTNIVITIAIPSSTTPPNPTLSVIASYIPTFPLVNWTGYAPLPVETIGDQLVYAFNVVRSGETPYPFTAGTEFKVATIAFTGLNKNSTKVRLADYTAENGGSSQYAYFYAETNVSSQLSNSLSSAMFYGEPGVSTVGSIGGVATSDGYAETVSSVVLPVTFISFGGTAKDCAANLAWSTATEQNNSYYSVEYSANGTSFETVGNVASKNSPTGASYTFGYNKLNGSVGYFRLKSVDVDGKYAYSAIVALAGSGNCKAGQMLSVWPVPTKNIINIGGVTTGDRINIFDGKGRILKQQQVTSTNQQIDIGSYANGIYWLKVVDANGYNTNTIKIGKVQ